MEDEKNKKETAEPAACKCCECGCEIENGAPRFKVPKSAIE